MGEPCHPMSMKTDLDLTDPRQMKAARHALGLTVTQMADALELRGVNAPKTVREWETGKRVAGGPARVAIRLMLERAGLL